MEGTQLNAAAAQYRRNAILTASPEKLVMMLLDGGLRFMDQAKIAIEQNKIAAAGEALSRTFAIVSELRGALDKEKGASIAADLDRLYGFILDRVVLANRRRELAPLEEAREILSTIKAGWDGVVASR